VNLVTLSVLAFHTHGDLRYLASLPPDFVVDAEGDTVGQSFVLDERARVGVDLTGKGWAVATEWDLFTGQLAGDPWDIAGDVDARHRETMGVLTAHSFVPRVATVQGLLGPVQFTGGLQTSYWGLGMVANDGAHEPTFGRTDFGDRVLRARFVTKPNGPTAPATFVFAVDRVVEDETASWALGQAAYQGVMAMRWDTAASHHGVYGVYRDQTEADGERVTRVAMLDAFGEHGGTSESCTWSMGGEVAGITGETSRVRTYAQPEGVRVASAGATGYAAMGMVSGKLGGRLRAGWASGDGNPDDSVSHDFTFDRDFDAGMVLFDEYSGAIEAATYNELADPEHTGHTTDGADALVTEGSFRRATFVQPMVESKVTDWMSARAGVLGAWSTAPITEPFYTYRNGGVATNQLGVETSGRWLGAEVDWGVTLAAPSSWKLRPELTVQGGYAIPSVDNGNPDRSVLALHTATARLRW